MSHKNGLGNAQLVMNGIHLWNKNGKNIKEKKSINPVTINSIEKKTSTRCNTGFSELDRVLGGGVVEGSLILLRW